MIARTALTPFSLSLLVKAFAAAVVVSACGGETPAPMAPATPARYPNATATVAAEPATIAEAEAAIAKARSELGGSPKPADGAAKPSAKTPAEPVMPPPPPSPTAQPKAERAPTTGGNAATEESTCSGSCLALASMRRAVRALCRMTGDRDARCKDAQKTLGESEAKVGPCGC